MKYSQWLSLVILIVCLYILWQIRSVLLLSFTAIVFAIVLNRAVIFLQRWIDSRRLAILALSAVIILVLGVFGAVIAPSFINQLQDLIDLTPQIVDQLQNFVDRAQQSNLPISLPGFEGLRSVIEQLQSLDIRMLLERFFRLFSNTLTITLNVLLVIVLTIMLLLDPSPYRKLFVRAFPSSIRQRVWHVMDECESSISGWFVGILFNMTVIAVLSTVGLWILGVPLALANGLLSGLLAFIPNLGPVISVVPPTAIALLEAPWKAGAVILLYVLIQQIESNVLTPIVMKKQVSLLPALTLVSQVVFALFFGFLGLLLALPLTLVIQNWLQEFWIKSFLDQH